MIHFDCTSYVAFLLIGGGYFFGSVPFGLIFSKLLGHGDLRKSGSGNIGATNALRTGGKLVGALTLIFDALKGVAAIFVARHFCDDYLLQIYVGFAAILGHVFPVWLNFHGGKGVATSLAVVVILNWYVGLLSCVVWLLTLIITRISAVSALVSFVLIPVVTYFMTYDNRLVIMTSAIAVLIVVRHISNIKKLLAKK